MSLTPLNSFFERFKHITPPDETIRKCVCEFVLCTYKKEITLKQVVVKNNIVFMQVNPVLKNEIFMRKKEIIEYIQQKTNKTVSDIK